MIRRATSIAALAFLTVVLTAAAAMAQTSSYPVSPSPTTSVKGISGSRGGGTAFTGSSQIPVGTLLLVALVVFGLSALFVARRRAARFAS
jgi:hypothetical protein